jgi:hypothetical protein
MRQEIGNPVHWSTSWETHEQDINAVLQTRVRLCEHGENYEPNKIILHLEWPSVKTEKATCHTTAEAHRVVAPRSKSGLLTCLYAAPFW